jgi:D-aspartate ligase
MNNKVIVFGASHLNMLGLVRSLGEAGIRPICILLNSKKGLVWESKYPQEKIYQESVESGFEYIISNYSNEKEKPFILSTDDRTASIIDKNYSKLKEHFIVPNAGEDGRITMLMEKSEIAKLAQKVGFTTPYTNIIVKGEILPQDIPYPCFVKPVISLEGSKKEPAICNNEVELNDSLSRFRSDRILVQEYVKKKDELCLQGFSIRIGKEIRAYLPFKEKFNRFTETSFGGYVHLEKFTNDDEFKQKVVDLLNKTQYEGLFSVEFLEGVNGKLYFTEINFRHDGFSYFTTTGGANLPAGWVMSKLKNEIVEGKLKDQVIGINELTDYTQFVKTKKISIFRWLWDCFKADSHLLYNKKDNKPLKYFIKSWLKRH